MTVRRIDGPRPRSSGLVLAILLGLGVLATGVAVINVKYLTRQQFDVLQQVRAERDDLDVQWGRLQIEEAALSTQTRIEDNARRRLSMYLPQGVEMRIVEVTVAQEPDDDR